MTAAVFAYVALNLARGARAAVRTRARARAVHLLAGLRPRHFLPAPFVLAAVAVTFAVLYQVPPLRWGWWTALGGTGNIVFGSTETTSGTPLEWIVPLLFLALLIPALPLFVEMEERRFRLGAESWSFRRRAWRGLQFGLAHLIVGIPIAAAVALSIGGWWFTVVYVRAFRGEGRERALDESTRAHLAYDLTVIVLVLAAVALSACVPKTSPSPAQTMDVRSPAFPAGGTVPVRFTCRGANVSPPLEWSGVPARAVELALVVDDPDAPRPPFTHWVLTGIDPGRSSLGEGEVPPGAVVARNSSGQPAYAGMCPPPGRAHHYRFTVHALSRQLRLAPATDTDTARKAVDGATIAQGSLSATFAT